MGIGCLVWVWGVGGRWSGKGRILATGLHEISRDLEGRFLARLSLNSLDLLFCYDY